MTPNSCSESLEPSISASTSFVVMSSRGSPRRFSPSCRPYSIRSSENGLENGSLRSSGSLSATSATFSGPTTSGSVLPRILSPSSMISFRSSTGRPMMSEKTHIGISSATEWTQSNSSSANARAEDVPREPADALLVGVHDARREALVDERAQPRVRGRVGVDHRPSRLELLRRQVLQRRAAELGRERLPVLRHREDVVVARQRPEPASVLLRLPVQRRVPAQEREPVVRHPLLPDVEVGEVDVVERPGRRATGRERSPRGRRSPGRGRRARAAASAATGGGARRTSSAPPVLARLVDRERIERRRREDVPRAHVELRAVARADDHAAVELAVGERALLVRAGVVERDPARRRPADAHRAAARPRPAGAAPSGASSAGPTSCQASDCHHCAGR